MRTFPVLIPTRWNTRLGVAGLTTNVHGAIASDVMRRWNLDCTKEYTLIFGVKKCTLAPGREEIE